MKPIEYVRQVVGPGYPGAKPSDGVLSHETEHAVPVPGTGRGQMQRGIDMEALPWVYERDDERGHLQRTPQRFARAPGSSGDLQQVAVIGMTAGPGGGICHGFHHDAAGCWECSANPSENEARCGRA